MIEPKQKPILFSAAMVKAILIGKKTQTRRVFNPEHIQIVTHPKCGFYFETFRKKQGGLDSTGQGPFIPSDWLHYCPYGTPGDLLTVKEAAWMWCERRPNGTTPKGRQKWHYVPLRSAEVRYVADHPKRPTLDVVSPKTGNKWGWRFKTGRFLPKWASRITLKITGIRVERLQGITESDVMAEGIEKKGDGDFVSTIHPIKGTWQRWPDAVTAYSKLWDSINGEKHPWSNNPWVWVVEFSKQKGI